MAAQNVFFYIFENIGYLYRAPDEPPQFGSRFLVKFGDYFQNQVTRRFRHAAAVFLKLMQRRAEQRFRTVHGKARQHRFHTRARQLKTHTVLIYAAADVGFGNFPVIDVGNFPLPCRQNISLILFRQRAGTQIVKMLDQRIQRVYSFALGFGIMPRAPKEGRMIFSDDATN